MEVVLRRNWSHDCDYTVAVLQVDGLQLKHYSCTNTGTTAGDTIEVNASYTIDRQFNDNFGA